MTYSEFLNEIIPYAEIDFAVFQRKLIFTNRKILGIRTPILRNLAKTLSVSIEELLSYPDEYYETVFIQLTAISALPYEQFVRYLPKCVALIDNWALCDSFKAKCIKKNKADFLRVLEELFQTGKEYYVRYVLVVFLFEYRQKEDIPTLLDYIRRVDAQPYYVHMALAWLTAEMLIRHYEEGISLLKEGVLPPKTHDKAIQKAIESYRLTTEQKEYLRSLKIKKKGS